MKSKMCYFVVFWKIVFYLGQLATVRKFDKFEIAIAIQQI